jgi:hypothetical protein
MWLPKPIYEALPAIYMVIGVIFLLGAVYLGFSHPAAIAYAGIGVVCALTGVFIRELRQEARERKEAASNDSEASDAS